MQRSFVVVCRIYISHQNRMNTKRDFYRGSLIKTILSLFDDRLSVIQWTSAQLLDLLHTWSKTDLDKGRDVPIRWNGRHYFRSFFSFSLSSIHFVLLSFTYDDRHGRRRSSTLVRLTQFFVVRFFAPPMWIVQVLRERSIGCVGWRSRTHLRKVRADFIDAQMRDHFFVHTKGERDLWLMMKLCNRRSLPWISKVFQRLNSSILIHTGFLQVFVIAFEFPLINHEPIFSICVSWKRILTSRSDEQLRAGWGGIRISASSGKTNWWPEIFLTMRRKNEWKSYLELDRRETMAKLRRFCTRRIENRQIDRYRRVLTDITVRRSEVIVIWSLMALLSVWTRSTSPVECKTTSVLEFESFSCSWSFSSISSSSSSLCSSSSESLA